MLVAFAVTLTAPVVERPTFGVAEAVVSASVVRSSCAWRIVTPTVRPSDAVTLIVEAVTLE